MKLSIVIPAHNEAGCIESTVRALHKKLSEESITHEILGVNDHSTDATRDILSRLSREIPTVRLVDNLGKSGYGLAVRSGLDAFTGDAVAIYMADASDTPEDLVRFFREMEQKDVDCVFGSRFTSSSRVVDYPLFKLVLNRIVNKAIQLAFTLKYNDITNAFKMYRRNVIAGLQPIMSQHFNLTVELPLKAIVRGYRYSVLPNDWLQRNTGESKLKLKEMGSRYLFIIIYCFIEKWLSRGDYLPEGSKSPSKDKAA